MVSHIKRIAKDMLKELKRKAWLDRKVGGVMKMYN